MSEAIHPAPPVRLTVQIVTWNSASIIEEALASLAEQTSAAFELIVVDNDSADNSAAQAETWFQSHPEQRGGVIRSPTNLGFCGGHNLAFRAAQGDWILQLNPDAVLPPDFVERALSIADRQPENVGTIAPLILLPDGSVDSAGLFMDRFRRLYDRGHSEPLGPRYQIEEEVPACTGAVALHRRAMLRDIAPDVEPGSPFDEQLLWMYYDDYDVGMRAWRRGWRVRYIPSLIAHHRRAGRSALRRRRSQPRREVEQTLMIRNRYLMMVKGERVGDLVRSLPWLVPFELARLAYLALRAPRTLRAYRQTIAKLPDAFKARRRLDDRVLASPARLP
jgi:N-acetylglucosaminyl-diphospho-decaprenol L-rhamnosyltransferase